LAYILWIIPAAKSLLKHSRREQRLNKKLMQSHPNLELWRVAKDQVTALVCRSSFAKPPPSKNIVSTLHGFAFWISRVFTGYFSSHKYSGSFLQTLFFLMKFGLMWSVVLVFIDVLRATDSARGFGAALAPNTHLFHFISAAAGTLFAVAFWGTRCKKVAKRLFGLGELSTDTLPYVFSGIWRCFSAGTRCLAGLCVTPFLRGHQRLYHLRNRTFHLRSDLPYESESIFLKTIFETLSGLKRHSMIKSDHQVLSALLTEFKAISKQSAR
jgi:hypothetical protein